MTGGPVAVAGPVVSLPELSLHSGGPHFPCQEATDLTLFHLNLSRASCAALRDGGLCC